MYKSGIYLFFCVLPLLAIAQKKAASKVNAGAAIVVPLTSANWIYKDGKAAFIQHDSRPAMKITLDKEHPGVVLLKDLNFEDGIIEYDVQLLGNRSFSPIYFRWQDSANSECLYLRNYRAGNPKANDALQYAPYVNGVWLWDLYHEYQTAADFRLQQWNHIKLVVSGKQMKTYINGAPKPNLQVPRLESDVVRGALAFDGNVIISNLIVRPGSVENLPSDEGMDVTLNDPRYLRAWLVSKPVVVPKGIDYQSELYPKPENTWDTIEAERKGMINLSRRFGKSETRRIVWLKTTIQSPAAQLKELDLGFSDDVYVYLNGSLIHVDKNTYNAYIRKEPDARISIENAKVVLPLRNGSNELLIGVANDSFGWGIIARLAMKETDTY